MVGGLGTVEGPLIGAAVYVVLQDLLGATGEVHLIALGAVSVIVMLVAPRGIAGFARDRLGWTLFPVARRPPRGAARDPARLDAAAARSRPRHCMWMMRF